jgi:hypothetical protein
MSKIDYTAIKVNQAVIIVLLLLAFILNTPWIGAGVALVMLVGTALGKPGFLPVYAGLLKPLGVVRPSVAADNPEPHRFAQGFGGVVIAFSVAALLLGNAVTGWILSWLVVALAALNLFAGFCVGCALYYWCNRLGIRGFSRQAPAGTFPGMRPGSRR